MIHPSSPHRDPADSPRASYWPTDYGEGCDTPIEHIAQAIASAPLPQSLRLDPVAVRTLAVHMAHAIQEHSERGTLHHILPGHQHSARADHESVSRLLAEFVSADRPRLHAKCLAFVLGHPLIGGASETAIAASEGITRAAVSKRCIRIQERMGLPTGRGMRSAQARASYSVRQKGRRARPPGRPWAWGGLLTQAIHAARQISATSHLQPGDN
jgi:hypothetical protein